MEYAGYILVEDASGCQFEVHEYRVRRLLSSTAMFKLDTGELVSQIDKNTFVIATTGESLVPVGER